MLVKALPFRRHVAVRLARPPLLELASNRVLELGPPGPKLYGGGYTEYVSATGQEALGYIDAMAQVLVRVFKEADEARVIELWTFAGWSNRGTTRKKDIGAS